MKILAISQRVAKLNEYKEQRDCLDQRWTDLAQKLGYVAIPLPNLSDPTAIIKTIKADAIIFSGGNSLAALDKTAADISPVRDKFEQDLLQLAITDKLPVLGICRGMQMINLFFGGSASKISGHVAHHHPIHFMNQNMKQTTREVNSFHHWGINESQLADSLVPFAQATDRTIEGFYHKELPIAGMMWHPEREQPCHQHDLQLIKEFLS